MRNTSQAFTVTNDVWMSCSEATSHFIIFPLWHVKAKENMNVRVCIYSLSPLCVIWCCVSFTEALKMPELTIHSTSHSCLFRHIFELGREWLLLCYEQWWSWSFIIYCVGWFGWVNTVCNRGHDHSACLNADQPCVNTVDSFNDDV